jgi:hypothetical protein
VCVPAAVGLRCSLERAQHRVLYSAIDR